MLVRKEGGKVGSCEEREGVLGRKEGECLGGKGEERGGVLVRKEGKC